MQQTQPVAQSIFRCPAVLKDLKIGQVQKVIAVAGSCLLLFSVQLACSWTVGLAIALTCSVITLSAEMFLRRNDSRDSNWLNHDFDKKALVINVAIRLMVLPVVLCVTIGLGVMPLQSVALQLMTGDLSLIFLATLVAPVAEEILFRGFIQERLEDLIALVDRHICTVPKIAQERISMIAQSLLFGAVHITGTQVMKRSMKVVVFCMTSLLGFVMTSLKKMDRSLLSPIALHASQNTGYVLGLLGAKRIFS